MKASFNVAEMIQRLKAKRQWHQEKRGELESAIRQLEDKADEAYRAYEHHLGAEAEIDDTLQIVQDLVEFPSGNPMTDPNAESDQ